ncbi:hypothetical protein Mal15_66270 [Stieleria maiorica]|uniref:Uncharacterized protein n=1 Tax=Stieleria maiorica TaxID=2795974 RepID=A0A5B9MRS2_9BACT|nr:hypothetical protein Mal15_66270 [Stieleria maiorica]
MEIDFSLDSATLTSRRSMRLWKAPGIHLLAKVATLAQRIDGAMTGLKPVPRCVQPSRSISANDNSSILTRVCSSESRSRIVTVLSLSDSPSTVMQNGVPASS